MIIKRIIERSVAFVKILILYKNFPAYFLNRLNLYPKPFLILCLRNGIRYKIRNKRISRGDYYVVNETWVHNTHSIARKCIKDNAIVLDIGAHIGVVSIFTATLAKNVRVYGFEPLKENIELFQENIALNNLQNRVIPVPLAVCGVKGQRKLYLSKNAKGANTFFPERLKTFSHFGAGGFKEVECVTLEDIFKRYHIEKCDFLKMDVEGAEYEILYATPPEYMQKIKCMSIETHTLKEAERQREHNEEMLKTFLGGNGFRFVEPREGVVWAKLIIGN